MAGVGIVDYATYVPRYRLRRDLIAEQWRAKSLGGTKAVANFDEDSLTLAYEAVRRLLADDKSRESIDGLFFASTTAPHWQRASSSFIAAACDLSEDVATMDVGGSLRCATTALRAALQAVGSGTHRRVAVGAADVREATPESVEEQLFGDAAAAVAIGGEGILAELIAQASRSDDFLDEWRRDRDRYVNSLSSRFSTERGFEANVVAVVRRLLEDTGTKPSEVNQLALYSPDGRAHLSAAKKLGFQMEQVVDVPVASAGVTGAAMPLALLCAALDRAEPNQLIMVVGYGDGADALLFRAAGGQKKSRAAPSHDRTLDVPTYSLYRKLRDFTRSGTEDGAVVSNVLLEKEDRQNVRLHATRCPRCGTVQFPLSKICVKCQAREGLEEVAMARRGKVFTFTRDYLYLAPNPPTVMAVVELEDGARFYCQMTDVEPDEVKIGQAVDLSLRRMKEGGGMHHYYWKCRPVWDEL